MIKTYESIAELREAYLARCLDGGRRASGGGGASWYGDETRAETIRMSAEGDTALVPEAERLLSRIDANVETPRKVWDRSVAGAYACVPDVLAGLPTPMRHQRHVPDERAPITILATTTSSGGISAGVLRRRGTTILALVMALTRIRPVSLYQLTVLDGNKDGTGETVILGKINTTPLDLATACYVLTSQGFARRMTYDLAEKLNGFTGGWPRKFKYSNPTSYYRSLVERLYFNPKDTLVIEAAKLDDEMLSNPVGWVNTQVTKFTALQESMV